MRSCAGCSGSLGAEAVRGAVKQGFVKPDTTSPLFLPPIPEPGKPSRGSQMQRLEDSEGCQQQCDPLSAAPAGPAGVFLPSLWRFCEQGLQLFIRGPPSLQVPGLPLPAGEAVGP